MIADCLEDLRVLLHNQDFFLFQIPLQVLFELPEECTTHILSPATSPSGEGIAVSLESSVNRMPASANA